MGTVSFRRFTPTSRPHLTVYALLLSQNVLRSQTSPLPSRCARTQSPESCSLKRSHRTTSGSDRTRAMGNHPPGHTRRGSLPYVYLWYCSRYLNFLVCVEHPRITFFQLQTHQYPPLITRVRRLPYLARTSSLPTAAVPWHAPTMLNHALQTTPLRARNQPSLRWP